MGRGRDVVHRLIAAVHDRRADRGGEDDVADAPARYGHRGRSIVTAEEPHRATEALGCPQASASDHARP
jgi:hypothetical protein